MHYRRHILVLVLAWALLAQVALAQAARQKVVSTSLCGDSYVMALVQGADIAALSWQADGPLSAAPPDLRGKAEARPDGESLSRFAGDDIVLGPGDPRRVEKFARANGSAIFRLGNARDFLGVSQNLLALGKFLHRESRAEAAIARLQDRLDQLTLAVHQTSAHRPRLLYLTPTLGTAGRGTWVDAAIQAAGGDNMADDLGIIGWGRIRLEQLAANKPDLLVLSYFSDGPPSLFNFRSQHPFVRKLRATTPQIMVPGKDWVCAGPDLVRASEIMANAIAKLPDGSAP